MARVLVTGATGFIGRQLVARLLERGERVRCLVRKPLVQELWGPGAVDTSVGDVTHSDSLAAAVRDIDVVYHLAGATNPARPETFAAVNAQGTRLVAEACSRQPQPPVLVYVSSLSAAGPATGGQPLTEASPPCPVSAYGRSKLAGERHLQELAGGLAVTILRPPIVFGPGDPFVKKLFRLVQWGINLAPRSATSLLSWLYVGDLVDAIVLAADRGKRLTARSEAPVEEQGIYFVALDRFTTAVEAAHLAAEIQGGRIYRTIHVPNFLCWFGARVNECRTRFSRRPHWFVSDKLREALVGPWTCSSAKAKRELGFHCRTDLAGGLRATYQWYRAQGWL